MPYVTVALFAALAFQPGTTPSQVTNPEWDDAWPALEAPILTNHRQITDRAEFVKAGEAYFNPAGDLVVFQAIPIPAPGEDADEQYSMYVGRLTDGGLQSELVSAPGSANTCGWFHPSDPRLMLFGSTSVPPATENTPGYKREGGRYSWDFPREMEVLTRRLDAEDPGATPLFERDGYDAEGSWSPDGRFVLYTHCEPGSNDGDLWIYDSEDDSHRELVAEEGYDGGPFFSPDGTRICYRSDRQGDGLLQVFVADLVFDEQTGAVTGIQGEMQLTENGHVNWCPFFTADGEYLFYATSEIGHANYEVFAVSAASFEIARPRVRITQGRGFDGLPVFNADNSKMMWTAQRGPQAEGEDRPSSQLWIADYDHEAFVEAYRQAQRDEIDARLRGSP